MFSLYSISSSLFPLEILNASAKHDFSKKLANSTWNKTGSRVWFDFLLLLAGHQEDTIRENGTPASDLTFLM